MEGLGGIPVPGLGLHVVAGFGEESGLSRTLGVHKAGGEPARCPVVEAGDRLLIEHQFIDAALELVTQLVGQQVEVVALEIDRIFDGFCGKLTVQKQSGHLGVEAAVFAVAHGDVVPAIAAAGQRGREGRVGAEVEVNKLLAIAQALAYRPAGDLPAFNAEILAVVGENVVLLSEPR